MGIKMAENYIFYFFLPVLFILNFEIEIKNNNNNKHGGF